MYSDILSGNSKYALLRQQSEIVKDITFKAMTTEGTVFMVAGNPGTGKTIVAAHVLQRLIDNGHNAILSSPNQSLRDAIVLSLGKQKIKDRILMKNLVIGSGAFMNSEEDEYDLVIVDEAQSINGNSFNGISPEKQYESILKAGKNVLLLFDDKQQIRAKEIGGKKSLKSIASKNGIEVFETYELSMQVRSSISNDFIQLIEFLFDKVETHPKEINFNNFNFEMHETPNSL